MNDVLKFKNFKRKFKQDQMLQFSHAKISFCQMSKYYLKESLWYIKRTRVYIEET